MTSVWKTKVLPGLNKIFDKDGKKAAAAEFLKSFNKEEIDKEIEDKKTELEPKLVETIEASPPEIKVKRFLFRYLISIGFVWLLST
uniref:RS1 n=1 Tax=Aegilops tauschii subsp. strangulata TaxID=200361 RepID=A0A453EIK7_AEGTS